uniref:Candidate secreted effector n=1 Tax=Meloidogyne incognita TaxID=6306 RepID=A0A914LGJ4_MELIC
MSNKQLHVSFVILPTPIGLVPVFNLQFDGLSIFTHLDILSWDVFGVGHFRGFCSVGHFREGHFQARQKTN